MKRPAKLLLGVLAAGSVTGLAFFGWSVKAKDDATVHFANGVQVTPVEVKQEDELAQLLEFKTWEFDVTCPANAESFVALSLAQNGGTPKVIAGGFGVASSTVAPTHFHCTVSFVPIAGGFFEAKQLKYCITTGIIHSTGTMPNPFVHAHGTTQDAEEMPVQNSVILMSGNLKKSYVAGLASQNEVALNLQFEVVPYTK